MALTFETLPAARAEPRRRTFSIRSRGQSGELAALEFGDPSRPLDAIFLHANGFNAMTYRQVLAPLGETLRILAVDQQGHGRSPQRSASDNRPDWLDLRDDLLALLEVIGGGPLVLAGHSMGGAVSITTAAVRPDRVRALALFDPVIVPAAVRARAEASGMASDNALASGADRRRAIFPDRETAFASYRGRGAFRTWPDEAVADYVADGFRDRSDGTVELACAPAWEASSFRAHDHDITPDLRAITAPVTVLRAEAGSTCRVETPADFNPANPEIIVRTIPGTTHFLPIERPELVRETLLEMTNLTAG